VNIAKPIRYVVGASSKYQHTKDEANISILYQLKAKYRFRTYSASVSHLELDLDQKLISSSPSMKDSTCKTKLYLHQFLRYYGNRQTDRQTDAGENIIPPRKVGDNESKGKQSKGFILKQL